MFFVNPVYIFSSTTGESQFDSGIFSEPRQIYDSNVRKIPETNVTDKMYTSSVLERLDKLEKKISAFTSKTCNNQEEVKVTDCEKVKDNTEDLEIKQLLFRKLTMFMNKRSVSTD